MFSKQIKTIKLQEYTCNSARTKKVKLQPIKSKGAKEIRFSYLRLAVSLARTILSMNPKRIDLVLHSMSSILYLRTIISSNNKIALQDGFNTKMRDFSLTTRVGELAQAISYMFAQDVLKSPLVIDFNGFLESQGSSIKVKRDSSPDFVLSESFIPRQVALLESKGSMVDQVNNGLKTTLREALNQCDSGMNILKKYPIGSSVSNSYASAVLLSEESNSWDSTIHFVDPEIENDKPVKDPVNFFKYHYSTWFMLLGFTEQALNLASGENLNLKMPTEIITINGNEYVILLENSMLFPNIFSDEFFQILNAEKRSFGISVSIFEVLNKGNLDDTLLENLVFEPISNEKLEVFTDGTIIIELF